MTLFIIVAVAATIAVGVSLVENAVIYKHRKKRLRDKLHTACGIYFNESLKNEAANVIQNKLSAFIIGYSCALLSFGYNETIVSEVMTEYADELTTFLTNN